MHWKIAVPTIPFWFSFIFTGKRLCLPKYYYDIYIYDLVKSFMCYTKLYSLQETQTAYKTLRYFFLSETIFCQQLEFSKLGLMNIP